MLKPFLVVACIALPLTAFAQEKANTQQSRMATCNKEAAAKDLKGDDRKKFMTDCLSTKEPSPSQQDKMKSCNKQAADKKLEGDVRKKFMSNCLST